MKELEFTVFHGTDLSVATDIINNGFQCKLSDEHWLGNGIYFYEDFSLAQWWTKNKTKKFSMNITNPAIIECKIKIASDRVLNLCELNGFKLYTELLDSFFSIHEKLGIRPKECIDVKKMRCIFFNFIFEMNKIDMIIAPFLKIDQPYFPKCEKELIFNRMNIMYTEKQFCLRENCQASIIISKKVMEDISNG